MSTYWWNGMKKKKAVLFSTGSWSSKSIFTSEIGVDQIGWYLMIFHEIWWYFMRFQDIWWYVMRFQDIWWYVMTFQDIWWHFRIFDDILRYSKTCTTASSKSCAFTELSGWANPQARCNGGWTPHTFGCLPCGPPSEITKLIYKPIWGFPIHGGTPIARWFLLGKIPSRNGW